MITVVYQGLESVSHRDTLLSVLPAGSEAMGGISFRSLRSRRLGASYVRETAAMIPLVMESGVAKASLTKDQAADLEDEYYRFLDDIPEIRHAVQFDHPSLPSRPVANVRTVPVLHDLDDEDELERLIDSYGNVAMSYDGHRGRISALLRRPGTVDRLYLARSHMALDEARTEGFTAVATNVWLAPGRYGEMSLWDGGKFHRVNSKRRDDLLKQHESRVASYGFDLDLLHDGDSREMQRLAAYSVMQWSKSVNQTQNAAASDISPKSEIARSEKRHPVSAITVPVPRPRTYLPGFYQEESTGLEETPDGGSVMRTTHTSRPTGETVRVCDSCYLKTNCPAFEAGSACAFKFPVEVRNETQMRSMLHAMVELQASRVAFARFAEEVNGGYPDPAVGEEMDRLFRMGNTVHRMADKRERLTVSLESEFSGGGTGVLSRIFGSEKRNAPDQGVLIGGVVEDAEASDR